MNHIKLPLSATALAIFTIAACQLDGPGDGTTGDDTAAATAALTTDDATAALDDACGADATMVVTPAVIPPTPTGVPVTLDVAVTNPDPASCAARSFQLHIVDTGLLFVPRPDAPGVPSTIVPLASGVTAHVTVTATAPASADPGDVIPVSFNVTEAPPPGQGQPPVIILPPQPGDGIPFTVAGVPGCQVSASHELMITSTSVVDDPIRTAFDPGSRDPRNGVWTFKRLAEGIARTPQDAPAMVEAMLSSFNTAQTVNGFTVNARPGLQAQVLASWPRTASGQLDLARAPVTLLAIVNRFDLRDLTNGDAGEGRFVFAFNLEPLPDAPPPLATIIFEYKLPATQDRDVMRWAEAFHLLGSLPFGERYNLVLQAITETFTRRGARPGHPNGSAINAVRTDEIPFGDNNLWELREFHLSPSSGRLEPSPLELTPDLSFNNSAVLAAYITANQPAIIAETQDLPVALDGAPFKAGAVFNDLRTWFAPGVDGEARHHFAINTCNGCHSVQETGTPFLHLAPRPAGAESLRSRWLTGTVINDPATGALRSFDDLGRRKADLKAIVCSGSDGPPRGKLRKGIHRSH